MRSLAFLLLPALVLACPAAAEAPLSPEAVAIIRDNIDSACPNGGEITRDGLVTRDLTGDGLGDLVVAHGAISCAGQAMPLTCGMHVCSLEFYVGQPGGGYQHNFSAINGLGEISDDPIPVIKVLTHNFGQSAIRWNGTAFAHIR